MIDITKFEIQGDAIILQNVNGKNITIPFDRFIEKYTKEKDERINDLRERIEELKETKNLHKTNYEQILKEYNQEKTERENIQLRVKNALESISKIDISNQETNYQKATSLFLEGDIDGSLNCMDDLDLEKDEKEIAQRRIFKAKLNEVKLDFKAAEYNYKKALKIYESYETYKQIAEFYSSIQKYEPAIDYYKLAVRNTQSSLEKGHTFRKIGVAFKEINNNVESEKNLLKASKCYDIFLQGINKNDIISSLRNLIGVLNLSNDLGVLYHRKRNYTLAKKSFNQGKEIINNLPEGASKLFEAGLIYFNGGNLLISTNEHKKAYDSFKLAVQAYEHQYKITKESNSWYLGSGYSKLSTICVLLGKQQEAETFFKKANEVLSEFFYTNVKICFNYSLIIEERGYYLESINLWDDAIKLYDDAMLKYEKIVSLSSPEFSSNLFQMYHKLSSAFLNKEEYERALLLIEKATTDINDYINYTQKLKEINYFLIKSWGICFLSLKKYKESKEKFLIAMSHLNNVKNRKYEESSIHYYSAMINTHTQKYTEAKPLYQKAIRIREGLLKRKQISQYEYFKMLFAYIIFKAYTIKEFDSEMKRIVKNIKSLGKHYQGIKPMIDEIELELNTAANKG